MNNNELKLRRLIAKEVKKTLSEESRKSLRENKRSRFPKLVDLIFEEDAKAGGGGGGMIDISAGPEAVLKAAKQLVSDPEKKEIFLAGLTDGDPKDEVITIKKGSRPAKGLEPTQSEIGSAQSLDDQIMDKYGNLDIGIAGGKVNSADGAFPILTFGNKILDGHHRWSQVYCTNPDAVLETAEISAPGVTNATEALGLTHAILFALYGQSPTKPFKGVNLFGWSPADVKKYVLDKIVPSALKKLADAGLISSPDDKEGAADMYAKNVAMLQKKPGEFSRTVMPQPADAGDKSALTQLPPEASSGAINYKDPKPSDVKGKTQKESRTNDGVVIVERWQKLAGLIK